MKPTPSTNDIGVDIIAQNSEGETVLVVQVKGTKLKNQKIKQTTLLQLQYATYNLQSDHEKIPFAMLVDLDNIEIFSGDNVNLSELIIVLNTTDVLSTYEPEFSSKRIFWYYLETLIEAWLHDLAYNWKSNTPPASEKLATIGLLQQLRGGTTYNVSNAS